MKLFWAWLRDHLTWRPGEEWNAMIRRKYGHYKLLLPAYLKHRMVSLGRVKREFGYNL